MIWRCSSESWIRAWRSSSPRFLQSRFWVIRRVGNGGFDRFVQRGVGSAGTCRERLEAGNGHQPRRHRGPALDLIRLLPHVEEDLAQKVFGRSLVSDKAKEPA